MLRRASVGGNKFVTDTGCEAFQKIGDTKTEMDVINYTGAEGFDGFIE